ncbi:uncharacterized protein LOC128261754 [Drosophila gunungcola]|uniref:uncharacterized protein LOC128261754 n=1 Tax=Drosophila gunungcola TaxID=103775 RepID=UPI0022DECBC9|nr:uncharacterized protein LOC128261754 [Drosophila gunungcola]
MNSHNIRLLFLVGVICAVLIAAHPHDNIVFPEDSNYDVLEESGSGYNSAEEFMNAMDDLVRRWQEYDEAQKNSTDYLSDRYEETTLDSIDFVTKFVYSD